MTMLHRFVAATCNSRLVNDKGRRILIVGMTHIVIAEAMQVDVDFRDLNQRSGITRLSHAFWLCEYLAKVFTRRICMNEEQLREIPIEKLTRWFVHYTPKWLRYRGSQYSIHDDIQHAINLTLSRQL